MTLIKTLIDIPERVHQGNFVRKLRGRSARRPNPSRLRRNAPTPCTESGTSLFSVNVAGHPDIGVDRQALRDCRVDHMEQLVVRIRGKDHLPIVAPLDDVLRLAGESVARKASHGRR